MQIAEGGIPIVASNSDELVSLIVSYCRKDMSMKADMFASFSKARNMTRLSLRGLNTLKLSSLSEYVKESLNSITYLDLSGNNTSYIQSVLQDLKGIENFPNLKQLTLRCTSKILDISAIKNCKKLIDIDISYSNVNSILGLEGLNNLQKLTLNNNNISSLKPIENLKNLEVLNLNNNDISDTSSYVYSDGSKKTYNNLEILANLNKNGKLKKLYLAGNDNIINWSPLSSLKWTDKSGW